MTPLARAALVLKDELCAVDLSNGMLLVEMKFTEAEFTNLARAVLQAIREPSIVAAGIGGNNGGDGIEGARDCRRAMIDAVLAEG